LHLEVRRDGRARCGCRVDRRFRGARLDRTEGGHGSSDTAARPASDRCELAAARSGSAGGRGAHHPGELPDHHDRTGDPQTAPLTAQTCNELTVTVTVTA